MVYIPPPYDMRLPRNFNLALPSLPLVAALEPKREVTFLRGSASGKIIDQMANTQSITTPLGGQGRIVTETGKRLEMQWGDPRDIEQTYSLKELHNELLDNLGQYRFNTAMTGTLIEVKGTLAQTDRFPTLDGVEDIYIIEQTCGNYTSLIRRQTGLALPNPYHYLRHKILDRGLIPRKQFAELYIRSIAGTRAIAGIENNQITKGYTDLYPDIPNLCTTLVGNASRKFWQCTGQPRILGGQVNIYEVRQHAVARDGLNLIAFGIPGI